MLLEPQKSSWYPLIICLAGRRPALGERKVRGHLALRQGTSPPAPPLRSSPMYALLGIDLGTTGVKVALFAADDGRTLSSAFIDYPLLHPQIGWAEQNPEDWWQATVTAIRTCLVGGVRNNVQPEDVRGVGLSGQMHGVVLLDEENRVLRPSIIWADQRSEAQCRWITERVGAA